MANAIAKGWACPACTELSGQLRSRLGPHEFLVLRRPGATGVYQCLVCHSNFVSELGEPTPRWRALAPGNAGRPVMPSQPDSPQAASR